MFKFYTGYTKFFFYLKILNNFKPNLYLPFFWYKRCSILRNRWAWLVIKLLHFASCLCKSSIQKTELQCYFIRFFSKYLKLLRYTAKREDFIFLNQNKIIHAVHWKINWVDGGGGSSSTFFSSGRGMPPSPPPE